MIIDVLVNHEKQTNADNSFKIELNYAKRNQPCENLHALLLIKDYPGKIYIQVFIQCDANCLNCQPGKPLHWLHHNQVLKRK